MNVILDELTPFEFFSHGGVAKVSVNDEISKACSVKKKYTFFSYKDYGRFFGNLYIMYLHNHEGISPNEVYCIVNSGLKMSAFIGDSEYVTDLKYDKVRTYESAKFYYCGDKSDSNVEPRDPYGIKNVCFSVISKNDEKWDEFMGQRIERGFDESELWNLDGTIAKFIYPRLKAFAEGELNCHPDNMSIEEWASVLSRMERGFELISSDEEKSDAEICVENEAIRLFAEYFFYLWN